MSETKHTPGPWEIDTDGSVMKGAMDHTLRDSYGKYLGSLCETADIPDLMSRGWLPTVEGEANARLISAAPDLLEACKAAVAALSMNATFPADIVAAKTWLNAAITKATGEKP